MIYIISVGDDFRVNCVKMPKRDDNLIQMYLSTAGLENQNNFVMEGELLYIPSIMNDINELDLDEAISAIEFLKTLDDESKEAFEELVQYIDNVYKPEMKCN